MINLENKRALITGATGGIGSEIAHTLHRLGCEVVITGTRVELLEKVAATCGDAKIHVLPCNLANRDEANTLFERAEDNFGPIDILINNAGMTRDGLIMRMRDEDFEEVININLTAVFRLCRSAVKSMLRRRKGRIINVSSVVASSGNPGQANYVASKAGIIGLTKSLALEVGSRGITVNAIAPGFIKTPMTDKLTDEQRLAIAQRIPLARFGEPEDIANAAAYLASDEAAYITGQTLHVNGGMYLA